MSTGPQAASPEFVDQVRRYNEAIGLDYVVPFRILGEPPHAGLGAILAPGCLNWSGEGHLTQSWRSQTLRAMFLVWSSKWPATSHS